MLTAACELTNLFSNSNAPVYTGIKFEMSSELL